jgi:hypothetical protein
MSHPQHIHISSPACIFIYRVLNPGPLVEAYPRRCFGFLALSSFQVLCAVHTPCAITFQSIQSNHASHATSLSPSCHPCSLRYRIFIAWLFCICTPSRCSASCVCCQLRSHALWFASGDSPCRHRICFCFFFRRCYASAISSTPVY